MLLKILSWRAWFDNFIPNFMLKTFLNFNFSNFCLEKPLRVTMTTHLDIKRNKFIFNFPESLNFSPGVSSQIILIFNTFAAGVRATFYFFFLRLKIKFISFFYFFILPVSLLYFLQRLNSRFHKEKIKLI